MVWERIFDVDVSFRMPTTRIALIVVERCACQPLAGKIYNHFSLKWSYLTFLGIFEIGSLVCATSPSSTVLIIGRAIAGIGASGLFSGALVIIAHTIPLRLRPSNFANLEHLVSSADDF